MTLSLLFRENHVIELSVQAGFPTISRQAGILTFVGSADASLLHLYILLLNQHTPISFRNNSYIYIRSV
jgi:hypothetical protein